MQYCNNTVNGVNTSTPEGYQRGIHMHNNMDIHFLCTHNIHVWLIYYHSTFGIRVKEVEKIKSSVHLLEFT